MNIDNLVRTDTPTILEEHPTHLREMAIEEMLADMQDYIDNECIAEATQVAYAMIKADATGQRVDEQKVLHGTSEEKIAGIVELKGYELFAFTLRSMLTDLLKDEEIDEYVQNVLIERGEK